jgi:GH15 family glucan-1,4-alpha-glucosidase
MDFVESGWRKVDHSIWEVRGPRRPFTHSRLMAWVALDRAIQGIEQFGLEGPLERWKKLRADIADEIINRAFNAEKNSFVQYFGGTSLDGALLMMPLVGFLPPSDSRVQGTVEAIVKELSYDGFIRRYTPNSDVDGLPGVEGVFLPCTFWLADNYAMMGRMAEAKKLFQRLLSIRNDVGLLAEEYDPKAGRLLGNFPQAFTHVSLINTAWNLEHAVKGPAEHRAG